MRNADTTADGREAIGDIDRRRVLQSIGGLGAAGLAGVQFGTTKATADDSPTSGTGGPDWENYTKTQLAADLDEPMAIDIAPDGRVFYTTRGQLTGVESDDEQGTGEVGMVDPETGEVTTILEIDVYISGEDGLQGLVLDPEFENNGWVYLYYSQSEDVVDDDLYKQLSRFTVEDGTIDPDSEVEIMRVPTPTDPCCHVGGDLVFGPEGNLYITVGDDTSPFESDGYTPIDERDGRELFDAQRSASNTADLRGSILRITPHEDGSYTTPEDNMFTEERGYGDEIEEGLVREEIYVMGCRNPFRMGVDQETGVLHWGDYGPDAREWDAERGPLGIVEFNRTSEPGFYGWPYVIGPNLPYIDGEFQDADNAEDESDEESDYVFESSGEPFDPENLVNSSPNNTGLEELPTPKEPEVWYPYSWDDLLNSPPDYATDYLPGEAPFPELEGGAPMGGPVFRSDNSFGEEALPEEFDGKNFIAEWGADWIKTVEYDEDGEVLNMEPFMPEEEFLSPMDLEIGPEGALYVLEYGEGYETEGTPQSGIYRIEHGCDTEGNGKDEDGWIQLFNGENLDGWTPKFSGSPVGENHNDTFTVEDGVLKAKYDDYDEWDDVFGHLFYDDEFSHYILRAEYRFVGEQASGGPDWAFRNNGLMLHGQTPEEMDVDQDYPDSIEVQLLGASTSDAERPTANLCTPGTHVVMDGELWEQHCTDSTSQTYCGDQWVTVTVVVRGNESIRHIVEDEGVVLSYTEPQLEDGTPLEDGTISIQAESHPTEFRRIELKELDPESPIEEGVPESVL